MTKPTTREVRIMRAKNRVCSAALVWYRHILKTGWHDKNTLHPLELACRRLVMVKREP